MRRFTSALLAGVVALGAAAPAFADPPRRYDRDWNDRRDRDWDDRRDRRDDRNNYRNGYRDGRHDTRYYKKNWKRGDHFDRRYYNYVVINDYNRYRDRYGRYLGHPGRGHYYVRDNDTGEILLIAAATGLVLWALNN